MKLCTWHDSFADVACAKFCSDMIPCHGVTLKPNFHRTWITMGKILGEMSPQVLFNTLPDVGRTVNIAGTNCEAESKQMGHLLFSPAITCIDKMYFPLSDNQLFLIKDKLYEPMIMYVINHWNGNVILAKSSSQRMHRKLSKWQIPMQTMARVSKRHFRFSAVISGNKHACTRMHIFVHVTYVYVYIRQKCPVNSIQCSIW